MHKRHSTESSLRRRLTLSMVLPYTGTKNIITLLKYHYTCATCCMSSVVFQNPENKLLLMNQPLFVLPEHCCCVLVA